MMNQVLLYRIFLIPQTFLLRGAVVELLQRVVPYAAVQDVDAGFNDFVGRNTLETNPYSCSELLAAVLTPVALPHWEAFSHQIR